LIFAVKPVAALYLHGRASKFGRREFWRQESS